MKPISELGKAAIGEDETNYVKSNVNFDIFCGRVSLMEVSRWVSSIVCKGLTSGKLYKEIELMDRRASSLIAVKDGTGVLSNRYLTYCDERWNCWFLPNHRSFDSYEEDRAKLSSYLSLEFKIPSDDFQMRFVNTSTCIKLSVEHNEERTYDYRLYFASVIRIPDVRSVDGESAVGFRKRKRMTVDEMSNDKKTYDINSCAVRMPTAHDGGGSFCGSSVRENA